MVCGKGWGDRWNETLWHGTKGDADYKTHEGNGEQVNTIRNQEDNQTGDT